MNLLDQLSFDASNTFITDFGEQIIYVPLNGAPIRMTALVFRDPASVFAGLAQSAGYKHEVMIANNSCNGRTVINKSKDQVIINNVVKGTTETFTVMQILTNDQGMWNLGVG